MAQAIHIGSEQGWLKRYRASVPHFRLRLLHQFAELTSVPSLRPGRRAAGAAGKAIEVGRLRTLKALRVNVPDVLEEGDDYLVLSHVGDTLARRLRAKPADAPSLLRRVAETLQDAHARGAYFGQPFPRNIAVSERIAFFDFEEDLEGAMDITHAQARDWLFFHYGVARVLRGNGAADVAEATRPALARESETVRRLLEAATQRVDRITRFLDHVGGSATPVRRSLATLSLALAS